MSDGNKKNAPFFYWHRGTAIRPCKSSGGVRKPSPNLMRWPGSNRPSYFVGSIFYIIYIYIYNLSYIIYIIINICLSNCLSQSVSVYGSKVDSQLHWIINISSWPNLGFLTHIQRVMVDSPGWDTSHIYAFPYTYSMPPHITHQIPIHIHMDIFMSRSGFSKWGIPKSCQTSPLEEGNQKFWVPQSWRTLCINVYVYICREITGKKRKLCVI